jgi:hypothetical protein
MAHRHRVGLPAHEIQLWLRNAESVADGREHPVDRWHLRGPQPHRTGQEPQVLPAIGHRAQVPFHGCLQQGNALQMLTGGEIQRMQEITNIENSGHGVPRVQTGIHVYLDGGCRNTS